MAEDGSDKVVNISIKLTAPTNIEEEDNKNPSLVGYRVRLVSEWLDCCGATGIFGKGDLLWSSPPAVEGKQDTNNESNITHKNEQNVVDKYAICQKPFPLPKFLLPGADGSDENDRKQKLITFNLKPGIYAILCKDERRTGAVEGEPSIITSIPLGFSHLDCSSFLMNPGVISANNLKIDGYELEVTVSLEGRMLSYPDIVEYEPMVLDLKRLNYYPVLENEVPGESTNGVYIYGNIPLGSGVHRTVLGFLPSTDDSEKVDIGVKLCVLPGLVADLQQFKDLLTSTNFVLEIHQGQDVFSRAFHLRNVEEYQQQMVTEKLQQTEALALLTPAKGKAKPPAKGKGAPDPNEGTEFAPTPFGSIKGSDRFLTLAIHKALQASRQLRAHGTIRFRLQNLLSSSNDMLTKFKRTRHGHHDDNE
jgi:hypothetical protein